MELDGALAQLSNDCRDFWAQNNGRVTRLASPPQPTTFQREYVQKSKPVVVAGAFTEWRCMKKWSLEYLASQNGDALVTVNATPDGRADSVKWCQLPEDTASRKVSAVRDSSDSTGASDPVRLFVLPEERQMTMRGFKAALTDCNSPQAKALGPNGVPYLSRQNDSLRAEFSAVADDVPSSGPAFAVGAFGECTAATSEGTNGSSGFEAVNLWVGDGRSVTSTHQDPYENLYCVLRGTKRFTLLPPCDAPFVNEQPFRQGQHRLKSLRASSVSGSKAAAAGILSTSTSISSSGIANSSSSTRHQTCAEDSVGVDASNGSEDGAGEWVVDILDGALNWVDALDEDSAGTSGHGTVGSGSNSNHSSITSRLVKHVSGSERKTSALVDALAASRTGQRATPVVVQVHAGECLYLPAMWYHRVEQLYDISLSLFPFQARAFQIVGQVLVWPHEVGVTIAVNFWHDMSFGPSHVLLSFLRNLTIPPPSVASALLREADEAQQHRSSSTVAGVKSLAQKQTSRGAERADGEANGAHAI